MSISFGKAFFISLVTLAIGVSKNDSNFTLSYNATNKAVTHITESMKNETIQEIKNFIVHKNDSLESKRQSKILEFKAFINGISSDVRELNNELSKFLILLKNIQMDKSLLKKTKRFWGKQISDSSKMYAQYVDSLNDIIKIKKGLDINLEQAEKITLREMQLVKNGLREVSVIIKNISLSKKKMSKFDITYSESKVGYSLNSSITKSNKYFSV